MHVSGASLWLPRCFRYETYDESSRLDDAGRRNGPENALLQVTIARTAVLVVRCAGWPPSRSV